MDCMRNQQIFGDANAFYDLENDGLYADSATILRRKRVLWSVKWWIVCWFSNIFVKQTRFMIYKMMDCMLIQQYMKQISELQQYAAE